MAALAQQIKGNFLLSRFKAFLAFQKHNCRTYSKAKPPEQHATNMGSRSVVDTGGIDFSKWRKIYSRDVGISNSMIPASVWTVLKVLQSGGIKF